MSFVSREHIHLLTSSLKFPEFSWVAFYWGSVDKYPGSFRNCKHPEKRNGKMNFWEPLAEHERHF